MTELSPAFAPWAELLGIFPDELSGALVPWLERLRLSIGTMAETSDSSGGEFDGFHDLARRGAWERLLATEWALADVAPEEFHRRIAMREQLFLSPAYRDARSARRTVALFDAGPEQLGAPRLAQLAVLIVLARRAREAGTEFAWGVIQDPRHKLHTTVDAPAIEAFLQARQSLPAAQTDMESWLGAGLGVSGSAESRSGDLPEWWLVGGRGLARFIRSSNDSQVLVEDVLEPGVRELAVEIESSHRGRRALRLELPAAEVCTRLIRNPFARGARSGPSVLESAGTPRAIRFTPYGNRLLVEDEKGLTSWPIPNSPNATPGKPKRIQVPEDAQLIAVGIDRKGLARLLRRDDGLEHNLDATLFSTAMAPGVRRAKMHWLALPVEPTVSRPLYVERRVARMTAKGPEIAPGVLLVDDEMNLAKLTFYAPEGSVALLDDGVAAVTVFQNNVVYVRQDRSAGTCELVVRHRDGDDERLSFGLRDTALQHVLFGFGGGAANPLYGAMAVKFEGQHWRTYFSRDGLRFVDVPLRLDEIVVGVSHDPYQTTPPGLVTLTAGEQHLSLVRAEGRIALPGAGTPIVGATANPAGPEVAWLTAAGEVVVYSLRHGTVVLRLLRGDAGRTQ